MVSSTLIFSLPGNESFTSQLAERLQIPLGEAEIRHFPDEESYVRVLSEVKDRDIILVCTLVRPDTKLLPLLFLTQTLKRLGAKRITLLSPYLAYMRQDRVFKVGEAVTSECFSALISEYADRLITVDPHLHRRSTLREIYTIPTQVLHAGELIAEWIRSRVKNPLLIGPDQESEQWVSQVASAIGAPYLVLHKIRHGDRDVEISLPDLSHYQGYHAVLLDDIISTARTMIEAVEKIRAAGMTPPICLGVHAVFAGDAYQALIETGVEKVATCNTISHPTNEIDITELIVKEINRGV